MLILLKLSKDWRGGNTPKDILRSHHHPDTQTRERHHQKRNLQSNILNMELLWWLRSKESTCQYRRHGFNLWVRKMPWRRKWQPTLVFLPRKSHGQRSLVGYSPWGCKRIRHDLVTKQQQHHPLTTHTYIWVKSIIATHFTLHWEIWLDFSDSAYF